MREQKFKAWDKEKKEMIYDVIEFELRMLELKPPEIPETFIGFGVFVGKRFELLQFIGLHDKNGKEDYISDLVKVNIGGMSYIRPIYQAKTGAYCIDLPVQTSTIGEAPIVLATIEHEIIGNIHSTPELLK